MVCLLRVGYRMGKAGCHDVIVLIASTHSITRFGISSIDQLCRKHRHQHRETYSVVKSSSADHNSVAISGIITCGVARSRMTPLSLGQTGSCGWVIPSSNKLQTKKMLNHRRRPRLIAIHEHRYACRLIVGGCGNGHVIAIAWMKT